MDRPATPERRVSIVTAHVKRLDSGSLAALVADLWEARGFETGREGPLVTATRGGESLTIAVGRPDPSVDADVVVGSASGTGGADVISAGDIAEMLLYAVDRPEGHALCERHLGGVPSTLRPPLAIAVRDRVTAARRVVPSVGVVLLGVLLVAGALGAVALVDAVPANERAVSPAAAPADSAVTPSSGGDGSTAGTYPSGINADGITNVASLARAHGAATSDANYTLYLDFTRPRDGQPGNPLVQRDLDIAVSAERYLLEEVTVVERSQTPTSPERTVYYNGQKWYAAVASGENTTYREISAGRWGAVSANPFALRWSLVSRYLSSPETDTTGRVVRDGEPMYRVVATGTPSALSSGTVQNYTAVAFVDQRGLVRDLSVDYTMVLSDRRYPVSLEVSYDRFGETTVDPPQWYYEQFNATGVQTPLWYYQSDGDGDSTPA